MERENHLKKKQPFRSQPLSVHGVGTVRPWAAVNLNIARGRHNVSARDGGLPASRRAGAGASLCALLRSLPRMHLLQSCQCIHSTNHTIARRTPLFLSPATLPLIHGPAAATGPASLPRNTRSRYGNALEKKRSKLQNEPNFRCKLLSINKKRRKIILFCDKLNLSIVERVASLKQICQTNPFFLSAGLSKRFKAFQRTWRKN
jgi:hypothetical protein